ncbi:MAG: hypothetical protein AAF826_06245 [Pseudomonadota bacterium]
MKTFITALALGFAAITPMASANVMPIDIPTTWPQDGAFDGNRGLLSIIVKGDKS